jgi:hypothetical protein
VENLTPRTQGVTAKLLVRKSCEFGECFFSDSLDSFNSQGS